jgi:L-amino acid N-acyltransferase YncA
MLIPKIRFAKKGDFRKVRLFDPHSQYIDPKKIQNKISQKEVIIALEGKKIIGLVKFSYLWATRPYLDLIWVDKTCRGKGLGQALLSFLESYLRKGGYHYLFTSSEEDEKEPQKWHQGMGFKKCGKLDKINLPQDEAGEVFFYKRIARGNPQEDKLKKYPVLPD